MLWGNIGNYEWQTLRFLYNHADVDFAVIGTGVDGIPETKDIDHSESLPFAARNMKCGSEARDLCTKDRFCASCWVDRPDVPRESFTNIETKVPSQVRWHNGWRSHQLQGRVMSLLILDALQASIQIWSDGTQGESRLSSDILSSSTGSIPSLLAAGVHSFSNLLVCIVCLRRRATLGRE